MTRPGKISRLPGGIAGGLTVRNTRGAIRPDQGIVSAFEIS
jgi:hypothetical protein